MVAYTYVIANNLAYILEMLFPRDNTFILQCHCIVHIFIYERLFRTLYSELRPLQ